MTGCTGTVCISVTQFQIPRPVFHPASYIHRIQTDDNVHLQLSLKKASQPRKKKIPQETKEMDAEHSALGIKIQYKSKCATPCQKTNAYAECAGEKNCHTVPTTGPKRLEGTRTSRGDKEGYIYRQNKKRRKEEKTVNRWDRTEKNVDKGREMWDISEGDGPMPPHYR